MEQASLERLLLESSALPPPGNDQVFNCACVRNGLALVLHGDNISSISTGCDDTPFGVAVRNTGLPDGREPELFGFLEDSLFLRRRGDAADVLMELDPADLATLRPWTIGMDEAVDGAALFCLQQRLAIVESDGS